MAADYLRRHVSLFGIPIRNILLVALVIQNAGISVLLHYSRHMPLVNGERYFASTAVLLTEVLKLAFYLSMALYDISTNPQSPESSTIGELAGAFSRAMFTGDSWKLAIPAMLYTLQNSLQYVAASNLDAATFSLAFQLKVVATAVLSSVFLGRALDLRKWASLAVMAFGVFMVQMSAVAQAPGPLSMKDLRDGVSFHSPRSMWEMEAEGNVAAGQLNKRSATYEGIDEDVLAANPRRNVSVGVGAVVVACILSGVAGVYFEKTLKAKDARASIWVRNVQLSFYSIWPALFLGVTFMDGEHFAKTGFFTGYNWVVWTVIGVQALGGVLIGLALNYTDGVTKGLATSVSAAIVVVVDALSTEINTAGMHWLGTAATLGAAYFFSSKTDDKALRPPPINVTQYEKDERGYFDLEATATPARSPLQNTFREGTSTSRPGTPGSEPRMRVKSPGLEMRMSKRDQ